VLWTRYQGAFPLEVAVWEMAADGETYLREVWARPVAPAPGGYAHIEVTGLAPGARHRFAFFELQGTLRSARSLVGRFRAALPEDAELPLVVGACSCTENGRGFAPLERAAERDDLDLFVLLGDTTYNDSATTLDEYRALWAENLGTPGYRGVRAGTSLLATWDDHEVANDWDAESVDPARRAAATQALFEHLPLRRSPGAPDRLWRSARWGRTLEVFVLDCRGERRPSQELYVSREQLDWLKAGLAASPAVFKIIANSVPIGDFPLPFDAARNDRWEGYPAQRDEILGHIHDGGITGVIWLSGDFHLACMGRLAESGVGSTQLEVLAGPGAKAGNPLWTVLFSPPFDWASGTNNYTALHLDPARREVRVVFTAGDGAVIADRTYAV